MRSCTRARHSEGAVFVRVRAGVRVCGWVYLLVRGGLMRRKSQLAQLSRP